MKKNRLLFITYFYGQKGNCPAEWADDKIKVLVRSGVNTILLTGLTVPRVSARNVRHIRVPSVSWNDFKIELSEFRLANKAVPLHIWVFAPVAFLLGNIVDMLLRFVTKGVSAGRWGWLLSATPVALWVVLRYAVTRVFTTGGPTSAHIVGGVLAKMRHVDLVCEFQDPLVGSEMTRSAMTGAISVRLERWLARSASAAVYVTKQAAKAAQERNPGNYRKIRAVYPGAWNFPPVAESRSSSGLRIEFLHLGTLYGTRNLDGFFASLDRLRAEGFKPAELVRVVNVGAVYGPMLQTYRQRTDFELVDTLPRRNALARANQADCLLLIQHTDSRSAETIPYKTYDYLNLGLPVFGVLQNFELAELVDSMGGFTCDASDPDSIRDALSRCLGSLSEPKSRRPVGSLSIEHQFLSILPRG